MYAGNLCSTQIGGKIELDGGMITHDSPQLKVVIHGHAGHRGPETIKVVLRIPPLGQQLQFLLWPDDIVRVEDPD